MGDAEEKGVVVMPSDNVGWNEFDEVNARLFTCPEGLTVPACLMAKIDRSHINIFTTPDLCDYEVSDVVGLFDLITDPDSGAIGVRRHCRAEQ